MTPATRNNHRDHGAPDSGLWFGRKTKPATHGIPVTLIRQARAIRVLDTDGTTVDAFGDTGKFWLAIPEPTPVQLAEQAAQKAAAQARTDAMLAQQARAEAAARAARHLSEQITADLIAATGTAEPVSTTWGDAGRPDTAVYYGRGGAGNRPSPRPILVRFNEHGNKLFDARTGALISHYASCTVAMWLAPAPNDGTIAAADLHAGDVVEWQTLGYHPEPVLITLTADPTLTTTGRLELAVEVDGLPTVLDLPADRRVHHVATPAAPPAPVVIVPCGGRKAPGLLPAGDKYTGSYHQMTRKAATALAEHTGARVIVLSARHGLLELGDLVDDYDLRMGQPGSVDVARIAEQAAHLGIADAPVTVIAGRAYADVVTAVWPHAIRILDGTSGMPHQMKRMAQVARGEWTIPTPPAAVPPLFDAALVAPAEPEQPSTPDGDVQLDLFGAPAPELEPAPPAPSLRNAAAYTGPQACEPAPELPHLARPDLHTDPLPIAEPP